MYARIESTTQSLESLGDAELVRRLKLGREDALEVLLQRHRDPLFRFCCHLMTSREDAEDICQETLARAITRVDCLQTGSAFRSWLFSIARNLSVDSYRSKKRTCPLPDDEAIPLPLYSETPHDRIETSEEHQTVAEALGKLTQNHQRVLLLREVNGLSYAAIAEEMQVSQSAVETLLFRARRRLREEYGKSAVPVVAVLNGLRDLATRLAGPVASGPLVAKLAVTTALVGTGAATTGQIAPLGMQTLHRAAIPHVATHHAAAQVVRPVQRAAPAPVGLHAPVPGRSLVRAATQTYVAHSYTTRRVNHVARRSIPAPPAPPRVVHHPNRHVSAPPPPAAAPAPATHPFASSGGGIPPTTAQSSPQPVASNPKAPGAPKSHVIAPSYPAAPGPTVAPAPAGQVFAPQSSQPAAPSATGHFIGNPVSTPVAQPSIGNPGVQSAAVQPAPTPQPTPATSSAPASGSHGKGHHH